MDAEFIHQGLGIDQNVTFQTMFHRIQPTGFFTSDFGDGDYAETTRLTWTPVYEADGACVLHFGGSRVSSVNGTVGVGQVIVAGSTFENQGLSCFRRARAF